MCIILCVERTCARKKLKKLERIAKKLSIFHSITLFFKNECYKLSNLKTIHYFSMKSTISSNNCSSCSTSFANETSLK